MAEFDHVSVIFLDAEGLWHVFVLKDRRIRIDNLKIGSVIKSHRFEARGNCGTKIRHGINSGSQKSAWEATKGNTYQTNRLAPLLKLVKTQNGEFVLLLDLAKAVRNAHEVARLFLQIPDVCLVDIENRSQ